MRKCIPALAKVGHIVQTTEGEWMFKALLAAKPDLGRMANLILVDKRVKELVELKLQVLA